ncbi:hypothetical protein [Acinetobacter soli]|uniref:hypothetical protein n=1 Tax=Acinetobacter soli TaxID=487316 RepID=UPI000DD0E3DE|nr:hypothetical protein [Acinetobacter soli]
MNEEKKIFIKREIKIISLDTKKSKNEILDLDVSEIPLLVCSIKKNNRTNHLDFSSWCFENAKLKKICLKKNRNF